MGRGPIEQEALNDAISNVIMIVGSFRPNLPEN